MSIKQHEKADDLVIDLTRAEYFAARSAPASPISLTLPDLIDPAPAPAGNRERYGDLGLAAALPIKRQRRRARFRDFDPLTVLAIAVVLTVGALMFTLLSIRP
jgi:hypothetical protein